MIQGGMEVEPPVFLLNHRGGKIAFYVSFPVKLQYEKSTNLPHLKNIPFTNVVFAFHHETTCIYTLPH